LATKIEEFVAFLGWEVDSEGLKKFNDQAKDLVTSFAKVAAAVVGATTAVTAFAVVTNKQTSINARLAESIDLSAESLENWTFLLGAIDFNAEKVVRTVKTLNDRIGQAAAGIGDAATVKDSIKALGLEFDELKRKAPEDQLKTILQGAKELESGQEAAAAATQLLGRQGAFMVGFLRDQQGSIEDLLVEQAKYNLLTEEGRESAKAFVGLWDNFNAVIDSAKAAFAAYLGDALSPLLEEFLKFVRENRELIKLRIAEWAERVGRFLGIVWDILRGMWDILNRVVDMFGGLENVLKALAAAGAVVFLTKIVRLLDTLGPLVLEAATNWQSLLTGLGAKAKLAGALGLIVLAGLAINSLVRFFQGKDSLVGDIGEMIAEQMDIAINALAEFFGFSKAEFDAWLVRMVEGFEAAGIAVFDFVSTVFNEISELFSTGTWDPILDAYQAMWSSLVNSLQGLWSDFVDWFASFIPNGILNALESISSKAREILSKIPGVGGPLASIIEMTQDVADTGVEVGRATEQTAPRRTAPTPTPTAVQAAALNPILRASIDQSRSATNRTFQIPQINIQQQPGESGEDLGRKIVETLEKEAAGAMRATDTGVII
jgi:hypothetical protein